MRLRNILVEVTVTAIRDQLPGSRRDWHQRIECPLTMFIKPGPVSVGWRRRLADDEEADGQQRRFENHNCTFDQIVRPRSAELGYWPLLRSMQKSQDDDLFAANFVDGDERQRREGNLSRPLDAPGRPRCGKVSNVPMRSITDCATRRADSGRSSAM